VEFDPLGRRAAYWLFPEHPGADMFGGSPASVRIRAENILHVFHQARPGQVRGYSWFSPVLLKMKDYDEYDDAQLMKQKIAACLAVLTSDVDGTAPPLGTSDGGQPAIDSLEPGMILNVPPGRSVSVVDPPRVNEFRDYSQVTLRAIATGLGVTYEDLTGDYTGMPFSAARMSRLSHYDDVQEWRWQTLIPQMCNPVWAWAMQVMQIMSIAGDPAPRAEWTAPPMPMIDPSQEGLAYQRNIRTGIITLSESIRERGYDPEQVFAEMAADNKKLDDLGLVLDSDPRKTSQAGLTQARPSGTINPDPSEFDDAEAEAAPPPPEQKKPANGGAEA
jgi:lambda family phage portal protein